MNALRGPVSPFNFFGYFTLQPNSLLAVVAAAAAEISGYLRLGPQSRWIVMLRSLATVCIVRVGIVCAALVTPIAEIQK